MAFIGRQLDPRAHYQNLTSGDTFRTASAYSYHVLKAPYELVRGLYHLPDALAALRDLDPKQLKCLLKGKYNDFINASPERQMEILAGLTGDAAGGWATGVGSANALKSLRALQAARSAQTRNLVTFQGLEVRAVRDLGHLDDATLRAMAERGFAAKNIDGSKIVLHHHRQNPAGPIVEMPAPNHSIGNVRQHPLGNAAGSGLTAQERAAFNAWRTDYWKARAAQELSRRAGGN